MFKKITKVFSNLPLILNPVPKIIVEGLSDDSKCTGCRFFRTLEESINGEPWYGYFNRNSGAKGFCTHPYKTDKMEDCAWVDFGCVNRREK